MSTERFDATAATWDADPDKITRAHEIAAAIIERVPLNRRTRVLEYGAGTGLVSQALQDRIGPLTLADNSAGMREVIAAKIENGALPRSQVWDLDLQTQPAPAQRFDLIICALVLHHVRELAPVLTGLATLLDPGGRVCIADLDAEDGSFHDVDFDGHHGFDREEFSTALTAAGFDDVEIADCTTIVREDRPFSVFLATAVRT